ncbi:MAG: hypothetical protein RRY65_00275 [Pseudoflavonifractor sp.]
MEKDFALGQGGGRLSLREEGSRVRFTADLPDDGRGLYKVYLLGDGGRLLLGTLVPEGGRLGLVRSVSTEELRRQRMWPAAGGEVLLVFPFGPEPGSQQPLWVREDAPARLLGDRLLSACAEGLCGAMILRTGEGFSLALPYDPTRAFPMTPLFCFAQIQTMGGGQYAVFHFNPRGCPRGFAVAEASKAGQS